MELPKRPDVPQLSADEIRHITEIVFGSEADQDRPAESILIFGGSHPGSWELGASLYQRYGALRVFVTGGHKEGAERHQSWNNGDQNEAEVISERLIGLGIPAGKIACENHSKNSLENVLFIRDAIQAQHAKSLMCVCKAYGAGRQLRTLRKHISGVDFAMWGFPVIDSRGEVSRRAWSDTAFGRSTVWGEYLRNCLYALKGDILADFRPLDSLLPKLMAFQSP